MARNLLLKILRDLLFVTLVSVASNLVWQLVFAFSLIEGSFQTVLVPFDLLLQVVQK